MAWAPHVNTIKRQSNQSQGFMKMNLNLAMQDTTLTAYNILVRSFLETCSAAWNPYKQNLFTKLRTYRSAQPDSRQMTTVAPLIVGPTSSETYNGTR